MLAELKPYPEYHETGEPLIGAIPAGWHARPLKRLCMRSALYGANIPASDYVASGVRFLRTTDITDDGVLRKGGVFVSDDDACEYLLGDGDLLVSRSGTIGRSFRYRAKAHGPCAYAGYLVRFVPAPIVHPDYLFYFTKCTVFADFLRISVVSSTIENVNGEKYANMPVLLPPPAEQAGIVRFLGAVDRKVNRFIRAKRRLIEVLTEQKQAIITHAVTKGLNHHALLKPSGIDWLGEVPAHWVVKRLRHIIRGRLTYGANESAEHDRTDWPRYLRITDFGGDGRLRADTFRSLPPEIAADYMVQPGDILLARSGATVGKAFLVDERATNACHAGYLIRARPNQVDVNPRFLFLYTQSTAYASWRAATFNIATIENIGADKYANLPIPLPPRAEQDTILQSLADRLEPGEGAIAAARREIDLIREYRTRLVADVVTGKLDVRGVPIPDQDAADAHAETEPPQEAEPSEDENVEDKQEAAAAEEARA